MAVRTKVRSKRPTLPFVAPEEHYATKADVADLKTELKTDIANLATKMANLRTELKTDIANLATKMANLRTELKTDIARLYGQLAGVKLFLSFNTALLLAILVKLFLS